MAKPFKFDGEDGESELRRWLGERMPEFVTLSDKIWKILADPACQDEGLKNERIVDMAKAFVQSGASCFEKTQLTEAQMAKFHQLMSGFISLASITVKGGLLERKEGEGKRYSKEEAAKYLNMSVSKLERKYKKERKIEYIKHGAGKTAKVEFEKAALDAYLQQHKHTPRQTKK